VLRNPYVAGVERFEAPFFTNHQENGPAPLEQAAHFCILLWQQFQTELRAFRYTLNRDLLADITIEFTQQPSFEELINVETHQAQQIDLELISQRPASTSKDMYNRFGQMDEHFPAFLEVFIPLHHNDPQPGATPAQALPESRLVIWCRPNLLPKVTALWERAATLLVHQS
jgi:hypothetical protein